MVFLWGYTHFVFVKDPENCIPGTGQLERDVIIQIEVYHNSTTLWKQRNKAITRLIIVNEITKCNASNMSGQAGEYVCASEDINSLYSRLFLVPVTQCSLSNYSRCNHVNHNIMKEVTQSVNQISKPLFYILGISGEKEFRPLYCTIVSIKWHVCGVSLIAKQNCVSLIVKQKSGLGLIITAIRFYFVYIIHSLLYTRVDVCM